MMFLGSGVGWKGFYPTSMSEHARKGYKTMQNDMTESLKLSAMFGDYVKASI